MSVFRHVFFAVMGCLLFFSALLRCGQSPNVPLIIIPETLNKPQYILTVIYNSKKKTNLLCILTTSFNIARFEHENEMRRKALKQKRNSESSPFWNPESTELESGIQ